MKTNAVTETEVTDVNEMDLLVDETNLEFGSWTRRAHGH
jgi:hypothetical protein